MTAVHTANGAPDATLLDGSVVCLLRRVTPGDESGFSVETEEKEGTVRVRLATTRKGKGPASQPGSGAPGQTSIKR